MRFSAHSPPYRVSSSSFKVKMDDDYQITDLFDGLCYSFCQQVWVKGIFGAYHTYITFIAVFLRILIFLLDFLCFGTKRLFDFGLPIV